MGANSRVDEQQVAGWGSCWLWFCVALLLLLWVDLATTVAAVGVYGLEAEANPIMRSLLGSGLAVTIAIHVIIFAVALAGFAAIVRIGQALDEPYHRHYRSCCLGWIGLLVLVGIAVAVNNIALVLVAIVG